jgi:hypothetical protein
LNALNINLRNAAPDWLDQAEYIASRVVAGDMSAALQSVSEGTREVVQPLAQQSFVTGFGSVLWVAGCVGLFAAALVGTLMRKPIPVMHLKVA